MATDALGSGRSSIATKALAVLGILVVFWVGRFAYDYFDANSPANLAMQVQLKMFGAAMYEYHSHTVAGRRQLMTSRKLHSLDKAACGGRRRIQSCSSGHRT
jgi:hypothetical protein